MKTAIKSNKNIIQASQPSTLSNNQGCLIALIIFILCIITGLMASCKKPDNIKPDQKPPLVKCAGCLKQRVPVLDTVIIRK